MWAISAGKKVSMGPFATTADGDTVVQAAMPALLGAVAAMAITREPSGGLRQPTGTILPSGQPPKNPA
ncbi:MAG: anti-sigma factor [Candidatus Sericytochromatia bacterium]|nr:anti-sigma factor [Candidatus Sericytochromatia bacterium]